MTDSIATYMTTDHQRCDHLLASCEQAIATGRWEGLTARANELASALLGHFELEEQVLFPELRAADPRAAGPTSVMRMEHDQIRALLDELGEAVENRDQEAGLGILETLHLVIQQHNAKEEGILYPMADISLAGQEDAILARLRVA